MFKKFLVILSSILLVVGLFACRNNAEVEELKQNLIKIEWRVQWKENILHY